MISISDKHLCCGCGACAQACPGHCISLERDEYGFLYPVINTSDCLDCGKCERVCPVLSCAVEPVVPALVFMGVNPSDTIRADSSSGGLFSLLSGKIISEGGSVCGAAFDSNWQVRHVFVNNEDDLALLRGSKYVQSEISDSYIRTAEFLSSGRNVLFSGTGCQIAGLRSFLGKEYDNLLTVEIACHGVPSPLVWEKYLEQVRGGSKITSVKFRDKSAGWKNYSVVIGLDSGIVLKESLKENSYMQFFLHHLDMRPSCHTCPFKSGKSGSDIIIADFWGISQVHPEMDDDKGTSLVIINTDKGLGLVRSLNLHMTELSYEQALVRNKSLIEPTPESRYAREFWSIFHKEGLLAANVVLRHFRPSRALLFAKAVKRLLSGSALVHKKDN